jgi:hypothetical protein
LSSLVWSWRCCREATPLGHSWCQVVRAPEARIYARCSVYVVHVPSRSIHSMRFVMSDDPIARCSTVYCTRYFLCGNGICFSWPTDMQSKLNGIALRVLGGRRSIGQRHRAETRPTWGWTWTERRCRPLVRQAIFRTLACPIGSQKRAPLSRQAAIGRTSKTERPSRSVYPHAPVVAGCASMS